MTTQAQSEARSKFSKFLAWQEKKDWQDKVFVCSLILFFIFYIILFSKFYQFPSEYYGGDQYAHFGSALKIYDTLNPFLSSHYYNELQHYPWLVPFAIAMLAKVSFQDPFEVAIYFPVLVLIATMGITYIFGKKYFENKTWALILAVSWAVQLVPTFHPSDIAKQLMIPLLCLFAFLLYPPREAVFSRKDAFVAGIIYGIAALEHVVTFFVASVIFLFAIVLKLIEKKDFYKQDAKKYAAVAIIGLACAALFWMPLLIKYHGETVNNWQQYTSQTIVPGADVVSAMFLESMDYGTGIISIIAGAVMIFGFCVGVTRKDKRIFVPLLLLAAGLVGIIHPYLTYPLFGMTLGYYRFPIVFVFVRQMLLVWGMYAITEYCLLPVIRKKQFLEQKRRIFGLCAVILLLLWIGASFYFMMQEYVQSERYGYAVTKDVRIEAYRDMRSFIESQHLIAENEVTLTLHSDIGFFFNAMTAKNVMLSRITHATPFVDHNQRAADMAVVLYGNDSKKAKEIIEEYHLAYFFSEVENIPFKYACLDRWNETVNGTKKDKTTAAYWCLQTDPKYKDYLAQYGIETATASVRLAAGDKDVPLTKILVIKPEQVKLNVEDVYEYKDETGGTVLKLYRIVGPSS